MVRDRNSILIDVETGSILTVDTPRKGTLLTIVFTSYFLICGGPFGVETLLAAHPALCLALLFAFPLLYGIPFSLIVAELACMHPKNGSSFLWIEHALGSRVSWFVSVISVPFFVFDLAAYPQLFVGYLGPAFCGLMGGSTPTPTPVTLVPSGTPVVSSMTALPATPTPHLALTSSQFHVLASNDFARSIASTPAALFSPVVPSGPVVPMPAATPPRPLPTRTRTPRAHGGGGDDDDDDEGDVPVLPPKDWDYSTDDDCPPAWVRAGGVVVVSVCVLALAVAGVDAAGVALAVLAFILMVPFAVWLVAAVVSGDFVWRPWVTELSLRPLVKRPVMIMNILFWNLSGWDNTAALAGEVTRPKDFVIGQLISCVLIIATYAVPLITAYGVAPDPERWIPVNGAEPEMNFASAAWLAPLIGGRSFVLLVAIAGMLAATGQYLANLLSYSFVLWRRAREGFYPSFFEVRMPGPGGICFDDPPSEDDDPAACNVPPLVVTDDAPLLPRRSTHTDHGATSTSEPPRSSVSAPLEQSLAADTRDPLAADPFPDRVVAYVTRDAVARGDFPPTPRRSVRVSVYDTYPAPVLLERHRLQFLWPCRFGLENRPPVTSLLLCVTLAIVMSLVFDSLEDILVIDNLFATVVVALEIMSFVVLRFKAPTSPRPFVALCKGRLGVLVAVPPLLCLLVLIGLNVMECFSHIWTGLGAAVTILIAFAGYPIWSRGLCGWLGGCRPNQNHSHA